jgi:lysine-N-methylase
MTLNLRALPILEQWDCHQCTACCRETTIELTADDRSKLEKQRWNERPEFQGVQAVRRSWWLGGSTVLAHKLDGSCVFLTAGGRCRIHELFGADAKPLMCRQFPLQVVTTDRAALATVIRSCPSAAADRGRPLADHVAYLQRIRRDNPIGDTTAEPPPIVRGIRRSWDDFHQVADAIERLMVDERFPLVRRLVHALRFCALLEGCKWKRIEGGAVAELVELFEDAAPNEVGELFQDRQPPARSTGRLFRRLGVHFIRCFPGGPPNRTILDHWRAFRLSGRLARATGDLPELHPRFKPISSEQLERPLGPLAEDVLLPLRRFFETHAVSKRYLLAQSKSSLVASIRRLVFTYPMAMWMLRWLSIDCEPTADDMILIVVALERGSALPALNRAAGFLAESGQLERLIAWYGR